MRPVPAASETASPTTPGGASPRASGRLLALAAFFSLSGLASLIDQVVWLRFLGLVFGNTTHAAATLSPSSSAAWGSARCCSPASPIAYAGRSCRTP